MLRTVQVKPPLADKNSVLTLIFTLLSLSASAQDSSLKENLEILKNPKQMLDPNGYVIKCVDNITYKEWNDALLSAKLCTQADIQNCFKFCSKSLEEKFDLRLSELQDKLFLVGLPSLHNLCYHSSPSEEMTSNWLDKKCPLKEKKYSNLQSLNPTL